MKDTKTNNEQSQITEIQNNNNNNQAQNNANQPQAEDEQIDSSKRLQDTQGQEKQNCFGQYLLDYLTDQFKKQFKRLENKVGDEARVIQVVLDCISDAFRNANHEEISDLNDAKNRIGMVDEFTKGVEKFFAPFGSEWQIIPIVCKKTYDIFFINIFEKFPELLEERLPSIILTDDDSICIEQYFIELLKKDFDRIQGNQNVKDDFDLSKDDQNMKDYISDMSDIFRKIVVMMGKERLRIFQSQIEELLKETKDPSIEFKGLLEKCIKLCQEALGVPTDYFTRQNNEIVAVNDEGDKFNANLGQEYLNNYNEDRKTFATKSHPLQSINFLGKYQAPGKRFDPLSSKELDELEKEAREYDAQDKIVKIDNFVQTKQQDISNDDDLEHFEKVIAIILKNLESHFNQGCMYDKLFDDLSNLLYSHTKVDKDYVRTKLNEIQGQIIELLNNKPQDPNQSQDFVYSCLLHCEEVIGEIRKAHGIEFDLRVESQDSKNEQQNKLILATKLKEGDDQIREPETKRLKTEDIYVQKSQDEDWSEYQSVNMGDSQGDENPKD